MVVVACFVNHDIPTCHLFMLQLLSVGARVCVTITWGLCVARKLELLDLPV